MNKSSTRFLAILLCLLMTLPLFACGGEEVTSQQTEAPVTEAPTETQAAAPTEQPTETPTEPETTEAPTEPETTEAPTEPETTEAPTEPETTEAPTAPETTEAPTEAPTEPETTEAPTEPETTEAPTEPETTETPTEAPTDPEDDTSPENDPTVDLKDYSNGAPADGAGAAWEDGVFAETEKEMATGDAIEMSADEAIALLKDKSGATLEMKIKVTEPLVLSGDTAYYGNMAGLIADGGIIIRDASNIVIKDLLIEGAVTVENSSDITLYQVQISNSSGIALTVDAASSDIKIESSILTASDCAMQSSGAEVSVFESRLSGNSAIISSGSDLSVQSCRINGYTLAIQSSGAYAIIRQNSFIGTDGEETGIEFAEGSYNGLIAQNSFRNITWTVKLDNTYNCTVLLNSVIYIGGFNNTNLYVVKNNVGGVIELKDNKYLLCDENSFPEDGKDHTIINRRNSEYNGNNLQDVDARVEHGANEELLPHTNKDLFLTMERRTVITDLSMTKALSYIDYVTTMAAGNGVVIVPPGAYSVTSLLALSAAQADTKIYAYGVYQEKAVEKDGNGLLKASVKESLGSALRIGGDNIQIHGLTIGYDFQSAGQVYVLEKFTDPTHGNCIRVVSSAGYASGFTGSNAAFSDAISGFAGDAVNEYYGDNKTGGEDSLLYVKTDTNGTMIYKMPDANAYEAVEPGDIFGCRLSGENAFCITLDAANTLLRDCVFYGYSAGLAFVATSRNSTNILLERVHNTTHSSPLIDQATYGWYKNLEKKYGLKSDGSNPYGGLGLEVYKDANGNYRGGLPRIGSVDGAHIIAAAQGVSATSCIFENMCDDSANQRASSARVAGYKDNGNGTTTIYYKGSLARIYFSIDGQSRKTESKPTADEMEFLKGDMMYAYTASGKTLIEAQVLSSYTPAGTLPATCHMVHTDSDGNCICDDESCLEPLHLDLVKNSDGSNARDCLCDVCGIKVHTDYGAGNLHFGEGDGKCNFCNADVTDADGDGYTDDSKKLFIIKNMEADTKYDPVSSTLTYKVYSWSGDYVINYSAKVYSVTVNTSDVDFSAFDGVDLTDNDYFMVEKIVCDNLSRNSANFTFDNVLMQNYRARGILAKTTDSTIKHCTVRNVAKAGILMCIEPSWGESTVPKNITIEGCLFEAPGTLSERTNFEFCGVSILGLGETEAEITLSENTLPSRNINIIGNKFVGVNNNYVIAISAAQDVTIKDNTIIARDPIEGEKYDVPRAIYINGAMNIDISGNTFENFGDLTADQYIKGFNYKGLHGSDVEGKLPEESDKKPAT